ncbi:MAG TPA: hypothetical protein VLX91_08205 [Candidatus Acidoferrales bacterium]|nr:hypothetical protein [Candidatus Acidoferrales bacterium]
MFTASASIGNGRLAVHESARGGFGDLLSRPFQRMAKKVGTVYPARRDSRLRQSIGIPQSGTPRGARIRQRRILGFAEPSVPPNVGTGF